MASIWITYAWDDNKTGDIDFLTQELQEHGLVVKLDRWNVTAGKRLWDQISQFITDPRESDAWVLIATSNSLASEACKEEFAYALNRALKSRGKDYPVIGLFLGPVEDSLIPPGIQSRLYVSVTDPDWKERIAASAEGRLQQVSRTKVEPYHIAVHPQPGPSYAIEVRPRGGVWAPFFAAIPVSEKDDVRPSIMIGPRDRPTHGGILTMTGEGQSADGKWWIMWAGNEATPTKSYYVWCKQLPSSLVFGVNGGPPQYTVRLST